MSACTAIDPTADVERAASFVADRSSDGVVDAKAWSTAWNGGDSDLAKIWNNASPLSSDDAVRLALAGSLEIRAAIERISMARADLVQAGLLPNPVLNVALGFAIDGSGGPVTVGAGLTQQLVALWLRDDRIRSADAALDATILDVSAQALRLVRDVRHAHAAVHFAERHSELIADGEAILDQLIELMRARQDAGEASALDVKRLLLQSRFASAERIEAERSVSRRRLELIALLGRAGASIEWELDATDYQSWFATTDSSTDSVASWRPVADLDEPLLLAAIDSQRLDLLAARAMSIAQERALGAEERQRIGRSVGAGVAYDRDDDGRQHLGPSVSLEIPIFDTNAAATTRAMARWRQAVIEADRIREAAVAEVRAALIDLHRFDELHRWYRDDLLPETDAQLELVQRIIDAGEVDATVLLEAQRERNDARRTLNAIERDVVSRRIDLEYAVGGRLPIPGD